MMSMKKIILNVFFLVFCTNIIFAKDYYLSNSGNDKSKGTSPDKSIATIERLNTIKLKPGDRVFFKSGDTFTGTIYITQSGKEGRPVLFSSYGEGEKPVISGSVKIKGFTKENKNLYSAFCHESIQYLILNNHFLTLARYPNTGYLKMDEGGKDYLVDFDFPFTSGEVEGANVRMRINNWQYEYRRLTGYNNSKIQFDSILWNRPDYVNTCEKGWGYYLDNKMIFLDANNEWFCSKENNKVYIARQKFAY